MNIFEVTAEGVIYVPDPEAMRKMWAIEEEYLTTVVVALLRERGYTVIEPGLNTL